LIDPRKLGGEAFTNQVADSVADYVNSSELAEDSREVLYPGQSALRTRNEQRENGIVVDDTVWSEVLALAAAKK
jgi:3-dehydro-L-gulonate 2-dehydrogenase